jgi:hypothetical protein
MTLATKSGGLILKDWKIATNCACCGDGICPCVPNMPTAFSVRLKNISVSFVGNFNTFDDFSGYEQELVDFAESYELISSRTSFTIGTRALYQTSESCYPSFGSCVPQACSDSSRYQYLNRAVSRLEVTCSQTARGILVFLESAVPCWSQFPNNRLNHWLDVRINYWGGQAGFFPPQEVFSYPFCDNQSLILDLGVPANTSAPGIYNAEALWRRGSGEGGRYAITGGSVEFTPILTNPLP